MRLMLALSFMRASHLINLACKKPTFEPKM
jgi:hypothetical protein